jgi:hypothetical protein
MRVQLADGLLAGPTATARSSSGGRTPRRFDAPSGSSTGSTDGELFVAVATAALPGHEAHLARLIAEALTKAADLDRAGRRRDAAPWLVGAGAGILLLMWEIFGGE